MITEQGLTVIIQFYKENEFQAKRAIESVLNQTYKDFEILLMLDKPENDELYNILKSYQELNNRIRVIRVEKNLGIGGIRNLAIENSSTEYISIMDGDDEYLEEKIEKQFNFMKSNPHIDITGTYTIWVDTNDESNNFKVKSMDIDEGIKYFSPIAQVSLMAKRELFYKYGFYDQKYIGSEDYELVLRWYLNGAKLANVEEFLVKYYKDMKNTGNAVRKQTWMGIKVKMKYRRQLKLSLKHYLKIILYDIPFFVIMPQKLVMIFVFIINKYIKRKNSIEL